MSQTWQPDGWRSRGACLSADPDLFFPISMTPASARQITQAMSCCARCPVRAECARYALDHSEVQGIWGGTTEDERRKLRRARARSAARSRRAA
jgi:WhiB family redox-sensing transcriptional regulator